MRNAIKNLEAFHKYPYFVICVSHGNNATEPRLKLNNTERQEQHQQPNVLPMEYLWQYFNKKFDLNMRLLSTFALWHLDYAQQIRWKLANGKFLPSRFCINL